MERIMTHLVDVAVTILIFFLYSCIRKGRLPLLQRLYVAASAFLLIWLLAIAGILGGVLTAVCRCSPYWTLSPAVPAR